MAGEEQGRLRKTHRIRINRDSWNRTGTVFAKEEQTFRSGKDLVDAVAETLPTCAHGHLIHNQNEIGGVCVCGSWLCAACAQLRCEIDGRVLCRAHADMVGGRAVCITHSVGRRLLFRLFER